MKLRDLTWRLKVPLAITAVILLTEVVVTTLLVTRALSDARRDLEASAESLTTLLARSLRDPLLRDDLWQAFEVVSAPLAARRSDSPLQGVVVLDASRQVFVSSDPRRLPLLTPATALPEPLAGIAIKATADSRFHFALGRGPDGPELAAAGAIVADDGSRLGTVVLDFNGAIYAERLRSAVVDNCPISSPPSGGSSFSTCSGDALPTRASACAICASGWARRLPAYQPSGTNKSSPGTLTRATSITAERSRSA